MATNAQRTQAICDGALNAVATQAQQLELAEALYYGSGLNVKAFSELTQAEKAAIIPKATLSYFREKVRALRESKRPAIASPETDYPDG